MTKENQPDANGRKPLRVLMVEDSEDDTLLEIRALKNGGYDPEYERVETAEAMCTALREKTWDIIVCDYQMPQFNGLAAIALLKETGIDFPLIIVSGAIGEETAADCMRYGAQDYAMKGNLSRLVPAIERELQEAESRRELKRLEGARLREQIMLARTEGIAHIGSWEWDIATDTVTWSDELFRIFQRDPLEGAPRFADHPAFYHPDDMARLRQAVETAVADGTPYELELRAIRKDGEIRLCVARGVTEMAPGVRAVSLFGSLQDITERKVAEEALLIKTMLLEAQSETSIDGILAVDNEGHSILFNKRFGELWMIPQHVLDTKDDAMMLVYILKQLKDPEEFSRRVQYLYEHHDEKSRDEVGFADGRYLDRYSSPLLSADGRYLGRIWFFRDITERKQAEDSLKETLESLGKAVNATIQVMVSAVEARDPYTSGHQVRSAALAEAIGAEMGLSGDKIDGLRMAGSIHDIGKLAVPAEILSKPTTLTGIEFALIKEHAQKGFEMLKDVVSPWPLAEIVHQHHERMDGSGYPRELKGDEIIMEARIMAVADVVESMASHRPYRPALGIEAALAEIEQNSGVLYDPDVAAACLRLFREKGFQLAEA